MSIVAAVAPVKSGDGVRRSASPLAPRYYQYSATIVLGATVRGGRIVANPDGTSSQIAIVTGPSGSGKTTYCERRVAATHAQGWDVAGVLSPARGDGAEKVGIDVVDLRSGERRALASLRPS